MVEKRVDKSSFVKWFSELSNKDISIAGGKGASLAEMYVNKFPIPPGFVVTAQSYKYFLEKTGLDVKISEILKNLDINDTEKLNEISKTIRNLIESEKMPKEIENSILESYDVLDVDKKSYSGAASGALEILKNSHEPPFVAVRSSATAEDLADASFAGQQDSFLNVKGEKDLLKKVRQCFSSLFTPRAIYYRTKKNFSHLETYLAVVVQKMVDSDKSGVIFSRNPVASNNSILIEAVWGLGEGIVSGRIKPDSYTISGNIDEFEILDSKISDKKTAIVRDSSGNNIVVKLSEERSMRQVLSQYELKRLSQYAKQLEEHYGKPQDIEFAISGEEIFIVQSRPITTKLEVKSESEVSGTVLLSGLGASPGVNFGTVKIIHNLDELSKIKQGDVLVTEMTNPDMVVSMQKASAIITDEGGITSHAAIVSREMGIPAIVGTEKATSILQDGQVVTVDGNTGKVFEGRGEAKAVIIEPIVPTKTKIKVIVDLPDYAERAAKSNSKSVGLVRLEGIIAASGKHPLKYVKENKIDQYIEVLNTGLKKIASYFEEVWVRSSDIRSDEYRNLEGASKEVEGNPMLGDHGIRFSLRHPEILRAEFTAIKEVADEFPNKKIGLMAPQIISVQELKEMKRIAREEVGVPKNVKVGIMVETPAAVQIINELCEEGIDFVSFGTNDLTQYTLAIDRNNGDVQYLYDEMNPAVLNSIKYVIRRCRHYGVETSICGQAGSKPEMAKFLVENGITSISVNADAAGKVSRLIAKVESGNNMNNIVEDNNTENILERREIEENNSNSENTYVGSDEDIEKVVLEELSDWDKEENNLGNEYVPSVKENPLKSEIPSLNEAIPIESEHFSEENSKEIIVERFPEENSDIVDLPDEVFESNGESEDVGEEWSPDSNSKEKDDEDDLGIFN